MTKKILALFFCVLILAFTVVSVSADNEYPVLIDNAGLLTEGEKGIIESRLKSVASQINYQLAIITVDSLNGYDVDDTAKAYFEEAGYGFGEDKDGALLLVSMEYRDVCIYSNRIDNDAVREKVTPYLSKANYFGAFDKFIDECKSHFTFHFGKNLLISVIIGLVVAYFVTKSMKSKLKPVEMKENAADYVKENSLNVTNSRDTFLYFTISKTPKPKSDDSSSGGSSHSSSSGKF